MNLWKSQHLSAAIAPLLLVSGSRGSSLAAEKLELPEGFPLWQESVQVRVGIGYKDNVMLSSFDPQGSAFALASVDAMLFRLPWNNWQLSLMAMGRAAHYLDRSLDVDAEQDAMVSGELAWFLGHGWKSLSTLHYTFINQVMDVSTTYGASVPQQVLGHGLTVKQGVHKDAGRWWAELNLSGSRDFFREPLDSYWQAGPQLTVGRYYGHGSEVSLTYQAVPLIYDSREQTDSTGAPLAGTHLRYLPQTVELSWQQQLDQARRWRNTLRLSYESSQDNGAGYYDYEQYRAGEQLRYRAGKWEVSALASVSYYDFPNQPVSLTDPRQRHRTSIRAGLRGETSLSKHWRVFATYEYERSLSNWDVEQYEANTVSGGVEFAF